VTQPEPGALGAALLAGYATGLYDDLEEISKRTAGTQTVYLPDPGRAALHQKRLESYRKLMALLLEQVY
jgi:sugar (pentulose or hexulose) kinase